MNKVCSLLGNLYYSNIRELLSSDDKTFLIPYGDHYFIYYL
jgi:hypothetical protein